MVIRDLSVAESHPRQHHDEIRIAFVADRLIAAVFDFLIFSPVVSFCVAGFMKEIKTDLLLNPHSPEADVVWVIFLLCSFGLAILLQSVFLYFWQATPGQRFMQLKVISYPRRFEALSFSQCLLRSFFWTFSFGLLAAPFLEIVGHPLRRAFHERASDTLVITLKEEYDHGPVPLERRFVGSWLRMFFLMLFTSLMIYGVKTYRMVQKGYFADRSTESGALCSKIPTEAYEGTHRQDIAVAMFLMDQVTPECLNKEADAALWGSVDGDKSWAYLSKALITEDKVDQEKYFKQACTSRKSEACRIADYFSQDQNDGAERLEALRSVTAKTLQLENALDQSEYENALVFIQDLRKEAPLKEALEKRYVRSMWSLRDEQKSSRQPASEETKDFFREFKDKYGVQ